MPKFEKRKFVYGPGGSLVCDFPIEGYTQELEENNASFYGGKYFLGETIMRSAAEKLALILGGELVDKGT